MKNGKPRETWSLKNLKRKGDFRPSIEQNFIYQTQLPFNPPSPFNLPFSEALPSRLFWPQAEKHTKSGVQNHQMDVLHSNIAPPCLHRIALVDFDLDSPSQNPRFVQGRIVGCGAWFFQVTFFWVFYLTSIWVIKRSLGRNQRVWRCVDQLNDRTIGKEKLCETATPLRNKTLQFENHLMTKWCNLNMFAWQEYLAKSLHGIRICFPNIL